MGLALIKQTMKVQQYNTNVKENEDGDDDGDDKKKYIMSMAIGGWCLMNTNHNVPSPRSGHVTCMDSERGLMYIFGGYHNKYCYTDIYTLHLATMHWDMLHTSGCIPTFSASSTAALLSRDCLAVFGGSGYPFGFKNSANLNLLNLKTLVWEKFETAGNIPGPRYGHSMTLFNQGAFASLLMFGGTTGLRFINDVYIFDFHSRKWTEIDLENDNDEEHDNAQHASTDVCDNDSFFSRPSPRYRHESVFFNDRFWVIGGGIPNPPQQSTVLEVFSFHIKSQQWRYHECSPANPSGSVPASRRSHACVEWNGSIYLFGGRDSAVAYNDLWRLDLVRMVWYEIIPNTSMDLPPPLYFHTMSITSYGRIIVFGGVLDLAGTCRSNAVYSMWVTVPPLSQLCINYLARLYYKAESDLKQETLHLLDEAPDDLLWQISPSVYR